MFLASAISGTEMAFVYTSTIRSENTGRSAFRNLCSRTTLTVYKQCRVVASGRNPAHIRETSGRDGPAQSLQQHTSPRTCASGVGGGRGAYLGGGGYDPNDGPSGAAGCDPEWLALFTLNSKRTTRRPFSQDRSRVWNELPFLHFFREVRISHVLLVLNVAVFLFQTALGPSLLMSGAKVNSAISAGEFYRLFSPMFLHASATHLLVNSFSLHSTGPSVESWFGKKRFLALYITSGVAGNLLSFFCSPVPAVGASGAIFGLVGATVVVLSRHRRILGTRARKGLNSLAYIVLMNFGMGMTPGSRIDNFGHLGGFLGGIAFAYFAGPRLIIHKKSSGKAYLKDTPIASVCLEELRLRILHLQALLRKR